MASKSRYRLACLRDGEMCRSPHFFDVGNDLYQLVRDIQFSFFYWPDQERSTIDENRLHLLLDDEGVSAFTITDGYSQDNQYILGNESFTLEFQATWTEHRDQPAMHLCCPTLLIH